MNHSLGMRVCQCSEYLASEVQLLIQRYARFQAHPQIGPVYVFHHHHQLVLVMEGGVQYCNVGMSQGGEKADLAIETLHPICVAASPGGDNLQRLDPVCDQVADAINRTHATVTHHIENLVGLDVRALCPGSHRIIVTQGSPTSDLDRMGRMDRNSAVHGLEMKRCAALADV